jgi:hypothetical protein
MKYPKDQLGDRVELMGEALLGYSACPHPFLQQASGQIFKDDVKKNSFSSTSDIVSFFTIYL